MNPDVDAYIDASRQWPREMTASRPVLLAADLTEEIKWGKPCYSHEGKNIAIVQEMKAFLALMFFKGALLHDPAGVLEAQGPNSRSAKRMTFTSVDDVSRLGATVTAYLAEAIHVEESGLDVGPAPEPTWAAELQDRLDTDPVFRTAFEALTPGRQREYNLSISDAKQATTRTAHVEKYAPRILAGKVSATADPVPPTPLDHASSGPCAPRPTASVSGRPCELEVGEVEPG